jgi:hypothetical protein
VEKFDEGESPEEVIVLPPAKAPQEAPEGIPRTQSSSGASGGGTHKPPISPSWPPDDGEGEAKKAQLEQPQAAEAIATITAPEKEVAPEEKTPKSETAHDDKRAKLHEEWEKALCKDREEEKQRFREIRARATMASGVSKTALNRTADIIEWAMWADYQEPLPAALEVKLDGDKPSMLGFNKELLSPHAYNSAKDLLSKHGLEDLNEEIKQKRAAEQEKIKPHFADAIRDLPTIKAITTVASSTALTTERQPLNETDRMVEESKLVSRIIQETGEATSPAKKNAIGHNEYVKGQFAIDSMTKTELTQEQQNQSRWQRVKDFINDAATKALEEGLEPESYETTPENDTASLATQYLYDNLTTPSDMGDNVILSFPTYTLLHELLRADPQTDFDQAFEAGLETAGAEVCDGLTQTMLDNDAYYEPSRHLDSSYLERQFWLHNPKTSYKVEKTSTQITSPFDQVAIFNPEWRRGPGDSRKIGKVLQRFELGRGRILEYIPQKESPFLETWEIPDNCFVISLYGQQREVPYIPGMKLIHRAFSKKPEEFIYFFTHEATADPYVPCLVPLPAIGLQQLIETYRTIGLSELTNSLTAIKNPTVSDLLEQLSTFRTYPYAKEEESSISITDLQQCAQFVSGGKIEAECTGAAIVLQLSLETLFGDKAVTNFIGGHLIKRKKIEKSGHAQVGFTHNNSLYYLDLGVGVPVSSVYTSSDSDPPAHSAPKVDRPPKTAEALQDIPLKEEKIIMPFNPAKSHRLFQEALSKAYQYPKFDSDRISQTMARLPESDPTFRTYNLSHRAAKYGLSDEIKDEMRRLRKFIGNIQTAQAKKDTLALAGTLHPYLNPETTSLLQVLDIHLKQYIE